MKSDFEQLHGRDPHDVLGVQRDADRQQLIRAFRWQARHGGHPDTGGDDQTFENLTRARDILLDADRLAAYEARQRAAHASRRPGYSTGRPADRPAASGMPGMSGESRASGVRQAANGAAQRAERTMGMAHQQVYAQATGQQSGNRPGGPIVPIVLVFFFLFVAPAIVRMLALLFAGR